MLNSVKKFAALAFVPIIMNISVIVVTYYLQEKYTAHYSIAYSLIVAGILQVGFMVFCLYKSDLNFPIIIAVKEKSVIQLVKNMGPATLGSGLLR